MCVQRSGTPGIYSRAVRPQGVCLYSVSEPRGSVCFVISPDNLYTFIYVINGRLEADAINSVVFNLCAPQVFPPHQYCDIHPRNGGGGVGEGVH